MGIKEWFAGLHQNDDEFEESGYDEYDVSSSAVTEQEADYSKKSAEQKSEKVLNMYSGSYQGGLRGASVKLVHPMRYEDIMSEPVRFLKENQTVLLNLEGLNDIKAKMRIIDFMAGVSKALDAKIEKVTECVYIAIPKTVDFENDKPEDEFTF